MSATINHSIETMDDLVLEKEELIQPLQIQNEDIFQIHKNQSEVEDEKYQSDDSNSASAKPVQ